MSKAKPLPTGETISKVYVLTAQGSLVEATPEQVMAILQSGGVLLTDQLASLKSSVEALSDLYGHNVEGYVRVAGISDPALGFKTYSRGVGMESVFDALRPVLVERGTGKPLHVLNPLNWYVDQGGHPVALDGSDGDCYITNIVDLYEISGHVTVGGVVYDVFLRSRAMFEWQGHSAKHIKPFGLSPDNVVAHLNSETNKTEMRSVCNSSFDGSYTAMAGLEGKFVYSGVGDGVTDSYDGSASIFGGAGGLQTTDLDLPTGEQYAMNLNADPTKTEPFFNEHARAVEIMTGHIIAEGGTFDAHRSSLMGSGNSSNDAVAAANFQASNTAAVNGARYVGSDGTTVRYAALSKTGFAGGSTYLGQMLNSWRQPWKLFERQRVMIYALQNNIAELTWFAFEGNLYKWRHVDGFAGPSEGAMTCVIWKMFSCKFASGSVDPTTGSSVAGNRIDFLFSTALYRGWQTDVAPSRWVSGLIFTEDSSGTYKAYYQPLQANMLKSPTNENLSTSTPLAFESAYDYLGEITGKPEGYRKDYNDRCIFLAKNAANATGGGLHTYVCGYNWLSGSNASAGTRSVRGFRRGRHAYVSLLSPFTLDAVSSPSYSGSRIGFGTCVQIAGDFPE